MTYEIDVIVEILDDFPLTARGETSDYKAGEIRWFNATLASSLVEEGLARYLTDEEENNFASEARMTPTT